MCSSVIENGNLIRITPDPIVLSEVADFVTDPSAGGVSIFMGKESDYMVLVKGHQIVLLTLYPKEKIKGLVSSVVHWPIRALDITEVECAEVGKTNCYSENVATSNC